MKSEIVETNDSYSFAEHAPWLTFFIGEKGKPLEKNYLFENSLKIAIQLAKTDKFGEYKSGNSAFEIWKDELKKQAAVIKTKQFAHHEVNLMIFNILLDSRQAAVKYLSSLKENMKKGDLIINKYKKEVDILKETQKNILPSFNSGAKSWTKEILFKQIDVLARISKIEKEIIEIFELELNY